MRTITITCALCGKSKHISLSEYRRQTKKGRQNWFCSVSHAAIYNNEKIKNKTINKLCVFCGKEFTTLTGKYEKTYCSASCASKATCNIEACRRGGYNSLHSATNAAGCLKHRELSKYKLLKEYLETHKLRYEFEKEICGSVFDLVLLDKNICIEFDGPYHRSEKQMITDAHKDKIAKVAGYTLIRIDCDANEVIKPDCLISLLH